MTSSESQRVSPTSPPLLDICNLSVGFRTDAATTTVVSDVSLRVFPGQTVALVGESGCGKSVTAMSVTRLIAEPPGEVLSGRIMFRTGDDAPAIDLLRLPRSEMQSIRGRHIGMVFQDPMTSLNPVFSVGEQIVEAIELNPKRRGKIARSIAIDLLRGVGIPAPEQRFRDYPHQLSGGMRQRVLLAIALAGEPSLLIADEPTTALDVTVERQILDLLQSIQAQSRMSILMITHDLRVVARVADYAYVMYAGKIVEHGPAKSVLGNPLHPYTKGLLECTPKVDEPAKRLGVIPGSVPDPGQMPSGCRFHPRCPLTQQRAAMGDRDVIPLAPSQAEPPQETKSEPRTSVRAASPAPSGSAAQNRSAIGVVATPTSEMSTSRAGAHGTPRTALRRCAEAHADHRTNETDTEPSGTPQLRELQPGHFAACWEAE